jgi:hypothetical protein
MNQDDRSSGTEVLVMQIEAAGILLPDGDMGHDSSFASTS